ncbi:MAG: STAS domain-containing protein [Coleofasciculus chthonoplastes F3-SA18-01]|jgi:anti-sigma B factor antagonist|uniref:STAS domain-containing protein n=1 Tax=Coleofasciculus chthonoplastes TaxID=64178 RepID=UPI0032F5F644
MAIATLDSKLSIVRPTGQVNASNAVELDHQLKSAILSDRYSTVLVDMQQVETLDSAGLGVLVSALRLAQRQNQRFSLCRVGNSVRMIFELTQLDQAMEIFESYDDFLATLTAKEDSPRRTMVYA